MLVPVYKEKVDRVIMSLKLDIKQLSMICSEERVFKECVRNSILLSDDADIMRFINALGFSQPSFGKLTMVAGYLFAAALFMIIGVVMITPLLLGSASPSYLNYFMRNALEIIRGFRFTGIITVVADAAISFLLIVSAILLIRHVSGILKKH